MSLKLAAFSSDPPDPPSVGSAIRDRQLASVRERLRRTNDPIDRVAEQCGFSNANYLKTLFKRSFGMTMREWRKKWATSNRERIV